MDISGLTQVVSKNLHFGFRKAFIRNAQLPTGARLLLIDLMTYKGVNYSCWPSQSTLSKDMGQSTDTVRKYMNLLVKEGYVVVKSRGIGRSLDYIPSYHKLLASKPIEKTQSPEPPEPIRQEPVEIVGHRSIDPGNIVKTISGKERFDKQRRKLHL